MRGDNQRAEAGKVQLAAQLSEARGDNQRAEAGKVQLAAQLNEAAQQVILD